MGVTITAVPATGGESLTPPTSTERDLQEFSQSLRNSPMAGLPQAANPATLAGEVLGGLKGYFEKAQTFESQLTTRVAALHGDGGGVTATSPAEAPASVAGSAGAPVPQDAGGGDGSDPAEARKLGIAELERAQDLAVQSQLFIAETSVVTHAAGSIPHTINTLLKGQ